MKHVLVLLLLLLAPMSVRAAKPAAICPDPVRPQLFLSPMGEPFRPGPDASGSGPDPVRRWFDQADRDHDGKLTIGEMMLDADRFFATLDKDHNGELLPDEVSLYEEDVAEVRLYQTRPEPSTLSRKDEQREREQLRATVRERQRGGTGYGGAIGAGRYSFLNIPNAVASTDDDINRAVSKAEFRSAAAERFRDLDVGQKKVLGFADLPKTPAQIAANAACLAKASAGPKDRTR